MDSNQTYIPEGFRQVTKEEFFYELAKDPREIIPKNISPLSTTWETKNRQLFGWNSKQEEVFALKIK